jgi:RNA polymerase sigma factor FliA
VRGLRPSGAQTVTEAATHRLDETPDDADAALAELWAAYVADRTPELRTG